MGYANRILENLPSSERKYMMKYGRPVKLMVGEVLCEADNPIRQVYFPMDGFISQAVMIDGALSLEMDLIGSEGMLGATLLLGEKNAPISAVVQCAGTALSMTASQLCRALCQNQQLLRTLNRYVFTTMQQWVQSAYCAHYHQTEPRLARFLLVAHDRAHQTQLSLTQDALSKLLGVRRSSITVAASELQQKKLIYYHRGEIDVVNQLGLEAMACPCYALSKKLL